MKMLLVANVIIVWLQNCQGCEIIANALVNFWGISSCGFLWMVQ
jgi:hypothetical protein